MIAKKNIDLAIIGLVVLSVVMYDVTIDLMLGLLHFVFEMLHMAFEWIELGIEHAVEHLFHTDRHGSQVITFYILWSIAMFGFYRLWKTVPRMYLTFKEMAVQAWIRRKTELTLYWLGLSPLHKLGVVVATLISLYLASFLVM